MYQQPLSTDDAVMYCKKGRMHKFLQEMDGIIPWGKLVEELSPHYPRGGGASGGRAPIGLERMLRIFFMQHWYNKSDPGMENALGEIPAFARFARLDLPREREPDESTICKFRHWLERNGLGERVFHVINASLAERGLGVSKGVAVDATIIRAPSSVKNEAGARDEAFGHTRKNGVWYFGGKAHISTDTKDKLIGRVELTPANVHDGTVLPDLLRGDETRVYGDSAYTGKTAAIKAKSPGAADFTHKRAFGKGNKLSKEERERNRTKSKTRAKVEHPFRIIKCQFGFNKFRYKGLPKNKNWLFVICALANVVMVKKKLLKRQPTGMPRARCA